MNINMRWIVPFSDAETVFGIASVYRRAFGGPPWNEGFRCVHPECGDAFPLSYEGTACPTCAQKGRAVPLVEYWPTATVVSDFSREMGKPEALCLVAEEGRQVVGFLWGYRLIADHAIDAYLDAPGLSGLINGPYFYIDDVAVDPERQGRGIGKRLVERVLEEKRTENVLARTLSGSRMHHILAEFGGRTVLGITRNRVIVGIDR